MMTGGLLDSSQFCSEHAESPMVREKVVVYLGGGHLGGEDIGREFRGAQIHIHPNRMKEISFHCKKYSTYKFAQKTNSS